MPPQTNLCYKSSFISYLFVFLVFFFFLALLVPSENFVALLEFFSFSNSLDFDASSQVVGKNGKLKCGSLLNSTAIDVAGPALEWPID